jgi:hypothetical protein
MFFMVDSPLLRGPRFPPLTMTRQQVLDLYFLDARCKLIEVAAFLDRVDRAEGSADFRLEELKATLPLLSLPEPGRARRILEALSDPTVEPIPQAPGKGACGAWKKPGNPA